MYEIEATNNPIYIALLFAILAAIMFTSIWLLSWGRRRSQKIKIL